LTDEQIVAILQEAAKGQKPIIDFCRDKGISEARFYSWRKKFGGMQVRDAQRLRELEKENARLKRLLAERDLEVALLSLKKLVSAPQKKAAVRCLVGRRGCSQRRACCLVGLSRAWWDCLVPRRATRCASEPTKPNWWSA
jgi:putative transposase